MALIKPGSMVAQASGTVGGTVYAQNRGGLYTRNWRKPPNSRTSNQQQVRDQLTLLIQRWRTLTDTQRTAWNLYGQNVLVLNRLGDPRSRSGINWYVACNVPRVQAGEAIIDDAPTIFDRGALTPPTYDPSLSGQTVDVTFDNTDAWANENGGFLNLYQGRPVNGSRGFFGGPYQYLGTIPGSSTTPPTSPMTFPVVFPIASTQALGMRATAGRADGRYSTAQTSLQAALPGALEAIINAVAFVTDGTDGQMRFTFAPGAYAGLAVAAGLGPTLLSLIQYSLDSGVSWAFFNSFLGQVVVDNLDFEATGIDISTATNWRVLAGPPFAIAPSMLGPYALVQPEGDVFPFP